MIPSCKALLPDLIKKFGSEIVKNNEVTVRRLVEDLRRGKGLKRLAVEMEETTVEVERKVIT